MAHQEAVAVWLHLFSASLPQVQAPEQWPQLGLEEQVAAVAVAAAAGLSYKVGFWMLGQLLLYAS